MVNAAPPNTSRIAASWTSHIGGTGISAGGVHDGKGGKPNIFIVPAATKTMPATIRNRPSIRLVQRGEAGSNIDTQSPVSAWFRGKTYTNETLLSASRSGTRNQRKGNR